MSALDGILQAGERLALAAERRDTTTGCPISLINAKGELAAAAAAYRAAIDRCKEEAQPAEDDTTALQAVELAVMPLRDAGEFQRAAALLLAHVQLAEAVGERDRLKSRLAELEAAIVPLAELDLRPDGFDKRPDEQVVYARDHTTITVGDVRRARAAIASAKGGGS